MGTRLYIFISVFLAYNLGAYLERSTLEALECPTINELILTEGLPGAEG